MPLSDVAYRKWRDQPFPDGSAVDELDEVHGDIALVDEWLVQIIIPYMQTGSVAPLVVDPVQSIGEIRTRLRRIEPHLDRVSSRSVAEYHGYLCVMECAMVEYEANVAEGQDLPS